MDSKVLLLLDQTGRCVVRDGDRGGHGGGGADRKDLIRGRNHREIGDGDDLAVGGNGRSAGAVDDELEIVLGFERGKIRKVDVCDGNPVASREILVDVDDECVIAVLVADVGLELARPRPAKRGRCDGCIPRHREAGGDADADVLFLGDDRRGGVAHRERRDGRRGASHVEDLVVRGQDARRAGDDLDRFVVTGGDAGDTDIEQEEVRRCGGREVLEGETVDCDLVALVEIVLDVQYESLSGILVFFEVRLHFVRGDAPDRYALNRGIPEHREARRNPDPKLNLLLDHREIDVIGDREAHRRRRRRSHREDLIGVRGERQGEDRDRPAVLIDDRRSAIDEQLEVVGRRRVEVGEVHVLERDVVADDEITRYVQNEGGVRVLVAHGRRDPSRGHPADGGGRDRAVPRHVEPGGNTDPDVVGGGDGRDRRVADRDRTYRRRRVVEEEELVG